MGIKEKLESMGKNSIVLNIARKEKYKLCATRFGGQPDVPPDFEWPTFEGKSYDGVVKLSLIHISRLLHALRQPVFMTVWRGAFLLSERSQCSWV